MELMSCANKSCQQERSSEQSSQVRQVPQAKLEDGALRPMPIKPKETAGAAHTSVSHES